MFTRSDILRRHEATHDVAAQSNGARRMNARACTECAKSRERCSKTHPCQRCMNKGLRCAYPTPRVARQPQEYRSDRSPSAIAFETAQNYASVDNLASLNEPVRMDHHPDRASSTIPSAINSFQQISQSEIPDYSQVQALQATFDLPMNWLPQDESLAIDYDSIVGLGIGSLDFFALPDSTADLAVTQSMRPESVTANEAQRHRQITTTAQRSANHVIDDSHQPWNEISPGTVDSYVSTESSRPTPHAVSPCDVLGGLYATSIDGARKPCTIRARGRHRPPPGAAALRPLNHIHSHSPEEDYGLEFPDVSHIAVDNAVNTSTGNGIHATLSLSDTTYDNITQAFTRLCLDDSSSFPTYKTSRFPEHSSLNHCVELYFLNFDPIMPLLHKTVIWMNDHWLLALAVTAVGCQYVEADEYAQMVEPMHELLRRAFVADFSVGRMGNVDRSKQGLAIAQAMVLSQVGMLYAGSTRLLDFAKTQRNALIELARVLQVPITSTEFTQWDAQHVNHGNIGDKPWEIAMINECKHRLICSIFLLDCMGVYHLQQHPVVPSELLGVPLPNDKLWRLTSAMAWTSHSASMEDMPCLSSAITSLFREKRVRTDLGQFSRVILLHGVYREIFQVKDFFTRPLSNWIPSMQQAAAESSPSNHSGVEYVGTSLLTSWRNAALDCVDVLHWAANGTIASQAGAEHPTVLHLHLSRTILLAPLDKFQALADAVVILARDAARNTNAHRLSCQSVVQAELEILEWAQRDACHARLAVLHSGCLFWHIRRYSCRAFYEPMAVVLATLTIWAYSSYASRRSGSPPNLHSRSNSDDEIEGHNQASRGAVGDTRDAASSQSSLDIEDIEPAPTFIHLDRPNDDEMVQAFVRFGTSTAMRANIAGVGDIHSAKSPARILREGRKILATVSTAWGRTARLTSVLEILEEISSGRLTLDSRQG